MTQTASAAAAPKSDARVLDCLRCPALCCRLAGYVAVTRDDIRRLAKHFSLTVPAFEAAHIVKRTRKGEKLIKLADHTCQFLGRDRRCTVYSARPKDCRGYYCWESEDVTVFEFARFLQTPVRAMRRIEQEEADAEG